MVLPIVLLAGHRTSVPANMGMVFSLCAPMGSTSRKSRLIGIRLASQAAAYLTVLGPAVSEPAKLTLLRNPTGACRRRSGDPGGDRVRFGSRRCSLDSPGRVQPLPGCGFARSLVRGSPIRRFARRPGNTTSFLSMVRRGCRRIARPTG